MKAKPLEIVLVHLALFAASFVVLYPVLWVLSTALTEASSLGSEGLIPRDPTLANFEAFLFTRDFHGRPLFLLQLGNSLLVSGAATLLGVMCALSAAFAFSRFSFPLRESGLKVMLLSQMFPAVVTAVPLFFLLDIFGLYGTVPGLVLIYATSSVPFSIWMLKGYFDLIPKDLDEAARLDGASNYVIFRRVMLPLVRPGIGITALFAFMTAYNEFIMASLFLDDATQYTLPITLEQHVGGFDPNWGVFAAGSLILSLPVVIVFFFAQRHMVKGLLAGAVK
jgi:arabinogalactan oligomer / maltooligosaccharide transport system permease protein